MIRIVFFTALPWESVRLVPQVYDDTSSGAKLEIVNVKTPRVTSNTWYNGNGLDEGAGIGLPEELVHSSVPDPKHSIETDVVGGTKMTSLSNTRSMLLTVASN